MKYRLHNYAHILGWEEGIESLLSALNVAASVRGKPAIIAVDALNESGERETLEEPLASDSCSNYTVSQSPHYGQLQK